MKYLRQIYYEMKHQKMMTWVSIAGTALSIFLVMVFYLVDRLGTVEVAPESNRGRILIGQNLEIAIEGAGDASGSLNFHRARQLYHNLKGVEREAYKTQRAREKDLNIKGGESFTTNVHMVDNEFWNIYDFTFIDGRPFEEADINSGVDKIILTRSLARKIFGEENVSGREILVGMEPFRVSGVVEDVNPLLNITYANAYIPFKAERGGSMERWDEWLGYTQVILLPKEGADESFIREQVRNRYKKLQSEIAKEGETITYHKQPYNTKTISKGVYGDHDPMEKSSFNWLIYALLILVPAINLSSMTRSRLRHRISEIGVCRAFGASRTAILRQTLTENFIIT
ncbi:MAG: ABC transporter permease, partial [Muribaculaceae bacterium]|nr:ABC transporter permease [Muribaculaceae bacterium]